MRREITEDSYELTPMQEGMLYDSLGSAESGMYCIQVDYSLRGPLDPSAFARAWQNVVDRHPALRTSFHWKDSERPYQVVHPRIELPVEHRDWSTLAPNEQERRLAALVDASERRGFELDRPPLIRLTLIRTGRDAFRFILSHHHLLLDGWCKTILFDEVFACYRAALRGETAELPEPRSYRTYVEWIRRQDLARAERFWRKELNGFSTPTRLLPEAPPGGPESPEYGAAGVELNRAATERLRLYARRKRLTLNTLVLGTWGLVLASASDQRDVVFGATVNGRPTALSGAESIVGLFINTLPVRVQISPEASLSDWLSELQIRQARSRDHDFTPLSEIQRWCAIPGGRRLFESIVVFENNPGYGDERERYGDIEVGDVRASIRNSLPLTLRSVPGAKLTFQLLYDGRRFARSAIECVGQQVTTLLSRLPESGGEGPSVGHQIQELRRASTKHESAKAVAFESAVAGRLRSARTARRR